jgi:hypothetical protein
MALTNARHWTVLLEIDLLGKVAARVSAGGRALLPSLQKESAEEALAYVEGALVDVLPGDTIEASVECPVASPQRYKVASHSIALMWMAETLLRLSRITRLARTTRELEPVCATTTRVKVLAEAPALGAQSFRRLN